MSAKTKLKMPKLDLGLLKNNFLIVVTMIMVFVFIFDFILWSVIRKTNVELRALSEKKAKIMSASTKIANFTKEKPYLKTEEFARKVPFAAIPAIAAMQQAGLIISQFSAYDSVTIGEEEEGNAKASGASGSKGGVDPSSQDLVAVGPKTLKEAEFNFKFSASYEDFMKILDKLSAAEPLIIVKGFVVKRIDSEQSGGKPIAGTPFVEASKVSGDLRKLEIELKLSSFAEISPAEGIWMIERPKQ